MVKVNKIGMQMGTNSTPLLAGKFKKKKRINVIKQETEYPTSYFVACLNKGTST